MTFYKFLLWSLHYDLRKALHKIGIHKYMNTSSMMCGNMKEIQKLEDWQKFSYRKCWLCPKEMSHSRFFHNIGIREKNAVPF